MAHAKGQLQVIQSELEKLDEYHIGYLLYFFMKAFTVSSYLIEVNSFDQQVVEVYKKNIRELLNSEVIHS